MSGPTVNQNHYGSGDNNVHIGRGYFRMTEAVMEEVAQKLGEPGELQMFAVGGERSQEAAQIFARFLVARGFSVPLIRKIGVMSPPLAAPVVVDGQSVFVDADR